MQYDSLSNMLQETQAGKSVQSVYNDLSFRTSLTYPNSRQLTFVPDALQRIDQVKESSNVIADYTYGGPARVIERAYLNGTTLTVNYDAGRRATGYVHMSGSTTVTAFAYHFDKEDNKLYEDRLHDSKGDAYVYDSIYRLTGVKYGVPNLDPASTYDDYTTYNSIENFGLDGVGNRISVTNGSTINYTTNNLNQYSQIDSQPLDYDDNGNLISGTANTHVYDYANRLLKVTRSSDSQVLAEYKYDALGRRFYKKAWDGSQYIETYFYYDGARCIEERNASDTVIAQYTFGNGIDEVLTMERNSETYYYHENSLGSIYAVTTATGTVAERYSYDAYGKPSFYDGAGNPISESAIGNDYLFTGQRYDPETGLHYYNARYYSPSMGRFLQRDPVGIDYLSNLYTYVENNPVNYADPSGLKALPVTPRPPRGTGAVLKRRKEDTAFWDLVKESQQLQREYLKQHAPEGKRGFPIYQLTLLGYEWRAMYFDRTDLMAQQKALRDSINNIKQTTRNLENYIKKLKGSFWLRLLEFAARREDPVRRYQKYIEGWQIELAKARIDFLKITEQLTKKELTPTQEAKEKASSMLERIVPLPLRVPTGEGPSITAPPENLPLITPKTYEKPK